MEYLSYLTSAFSKDPTLPLIKRDEYQVIRIKSAINQNTYEKFIEQFEKCEKEKPLYLELTTLGGSVMWACMIAKVLHTHPEKVICRIPYYALSAGTFLALNCDQIQMSEFATMSGFNPQIYGIDSTTVNELFTTLMKNGFKESFTEVLTNFSQKTAETDTKFGLNNMKKVLSKKCVNSEELINLFIKEINHEEQLTYDELKEYNLHNLIDVMQIKDLNLEKYSTFKSEMNPCDMDLLKTMSKKYITS